jgi:uncharacterized protein YbjT (DUF2867 family)
MRILVVGGTGTVGRPTVEELARRGHDVRVLSRHARPDAGPARQVTGDLATGAGLAEAMDGADAVVDVSNVTTLDEGVATRFFVPATERLVAAEAAAGVRQHVLLSIVGVDSVPTGYYKAKLAQERALTAAADAAGLRWRVLRATQFHEFAGQMIERLRRGPLVPAPVMAVQPVSTVDVARALADAVEEPDRPSGRLPDLAGPEAMSFTSMVRAVLSARGERVLVVPLPLPGVAGRAMRAGALRPEPEAPVRTGTVTFADYLERVRRSPVATV